MEADLVLKEIEQNPIYETICNMIEENTKTMEQMGSISVESSIIEDKCIPVTKVFTQHMSKKFTGTEILGHKVEYLGAGAFRSVYKIDDKIIKIRNWNNTSNKEEIDLVKHAKSTSAKILEYIRPVLAYNDNIIIAQYGEICTQSDIETITSIINKLLNNNIFIDDLVFKRPEQFVKINGKIVVGDYADWEYISDEELEEYL